MLTPERLRADARSLQTLAALNPGHLRLSYAAPDLRRFAVDARLDGPVADGDGYRIAPEHRLLLEIPDNYLARDGAGRFVKSRIRREGERIFHPNVYSHDGYLCFDDQFFPGKSLADQLGSALDILQCRAVNHGSPADWEADYVFLREGDGLAARLRQVPIRFPRGGLSIVTRSAPRLR